MLINNNTQTKNNSIGSGFNGLSVNRQVSTISIFITFFIISFFSVTINAFGQTTSNLQPYIVPREGWVAATPSTLFDNSCNESNGTLTNIFIHHTSAENSTAESISQGNEYAWVWFIQQEQMAKGNCDIAYHYLIGPSGTIFEGRKGGIRTKGAHVENMNTGTVGIAMLGNFQNNLPTAQAMESLRTLLVWLLLDNKLEPEGLGHMTTGYYFSPTISGHRHINWSERYDNHTACPGDRLFNQLATLRREVNDKIRNLESRYLYKTSSNPTIYRVRNGVKQPFTSAYVFNSYFGDRWDFVKTVDSTYLSRYASGSAVPFRDGTLIGYSDRPWDSTIFVVYNGKKRAFTDWNYFLTLGGRYQLGYSADKIMRVPGSIIDQLPRDVDMVDIVHCTDCRNT